jgi:hypothetical protein
VNLVVTLAGSDETAKRTDQASTLMHELGHNLGLDHGGFIPDGAGQMILDPDQKSGNNKPHYLSVMNYSYSIQLLRANGAYAMDFARYSVAGFREDQLNEQTGFTVTSVPDTQAIINYEGVRYALPHPPEQNAVTRELSGYAWGELDFDQNNDIAGSYVAADLNGNGTTSDAFPEVGDDWSRLEYDAPAKQAQPSASGYAGHQVTIKHCAGRQHQDARHDTERPHGSL